MKKIDLHIHTVPNGTEPQFDFDLEYLLQYVATQELDCVAITNHNKFDREQFENILENVAIPIFPGIEIDLEGGQLLLISDGLDLNGFHTSCQQVQLKEPSKAQPLAADDLYEIFGDLNNYLLIPHYDKNPKVSDDVLEQLKEYIFAGEVSSPKKFIYSIKDDSRLVPVIFSDARMKAENASYPVRQTYIDCDQLTFNALKSCLRDKNKVALSESDGNKLFQIFDDGQQISTGLNVVLGERSSGKSHTLRRIYESSEHNKIKFIQQFSLVSSDEEKEKDRYNKILRDQHSLVAKDYLDGLQNVVREVMDIDTDHIQRKIDAYLTSLVKFAKEKDKHDSFAKAALFSEERFQIRDQNVLEQLIKSTQNLIENIEYKGIVQKHVSLRSLKSLIIELINVFRSNRQQNQEKEWVNDLITDIKRKLQVKTAASGIPDLDLYKVAIDLTKVAKFKKIVNLAKKQKEIVRKPISGFEVVATVGPFQGAMEIKRALGSKCAFSNAFSNYGNPYLYLQELKAIDGLPASEIHHCFVKIDYHVLNKDGYRVSGGERSEFNLLQEIDDAHKHDMLLIDEPESSFDNLFLRKEVNALIKDISRSMPVVLVTHNNTVGASIKPNYILCTKKISNSDEVTYHVFSGYPTSKKLKSVQGGEVSTWDITMGCLEAGHEAYEERKRGYEDIKD